MDNFIFKFMRIWKINLEYKCINYICNIYHKESECVAENNKKYYTSVNTKKRKDLLYAVNLERSTIYIITKILIF